MNKEILALRIAARAFAQLYLSSENDRGESWEDENSADRCAHELMDAVNDFDALYKIDNTKTNIISTIADRCRMRNEKPVNPDTISLLNDIDFLLKEIGKLRLQLTSGISQCNAILHDVLLSGNPEVLEQSLSTTEKSQYRTSPPKTIPEPKNKPPGIVILREGQDDRRRTEIRC